MNNFCFLFLVMCLVQTNGMSRQMVVTATTTRCISHSLNTFYKNHRHCYRHVYVRKLSLKEIDYTKWNS